MTASDEIPIPSAYAVVPTKEEVDLAQPVPAVRARVELDRPLGSGVSPEFESIPEARGLTWTDDFFDDEEGLIAAFDLDYDSMECQYKTLSWGCLGGTVLCFPSVIPFLLVGLVPCYVNQNVKWNVRAQHLAVTRNGILFIHDKRPSLWGDSCTVGKRTMIVPFDQITDCTVAESTSPSSTCTIGGALSHVTVNTPGSNNNKNEMKIVGLQNPRAFQKLVLAMKRYGGVHHQQSSNSHATSLPVALDRIDRSLDSNNAGENVSGLLREIRDELRQNNEMLQSMKPTSQS